MEPELAKTRSSGPVITFVGVLFMVVAIAKSEMDFVIVSVLFISALLLIVAGVIIYLNDRGM